MGQLATVMIAPPLIAQSHVHQDLREMIWWAKVRLRGIQVRPVQTPIWFDLCVAPVEIAVNSAGAACIEHFVCPEVGIPRLHNIERKTPNLLQLSYRNRQCALLFNLRGKGWFRRSSKAGVQKLQWGF